jgi:hypothetical protein
MKPVPVLPVLLLDAATGGAFEEGHLGCIAPGRMSGRGHS